MNIFALMAVALAANALPANSERLHNARSVLSEDGKNRADKLSARTALITFSGLWNGVDPYTNYAALHRPMPSTYQPLMDVEPFTKPADGGNFGIRIGWGTAQCSNHGLNHSVLDHTRDATPDGKISGHELGGGVMFALESCSITLSKPVEIPSLYWTFYEAPTGPVLNNGTISVFQNVSDTTPLKSVEVPYHDTKGFVWRKLTAFAGLKVTKIVFNPRGQNTGLNIDDIAVRISDNN